MTKLDITLPHHAYPIWIGAGALESAAHEIFDARPGRRAAVVSDETVWALHGGHLREILHRLGVDAAPVIIPAGEKSKSLDMLQLLYQEFYRAGLRRADPVIAFGGGVVGDLAGFAASTYMRGVPFVQIPTTLLAQVDSSVGGKVAVNLSEGKNLVGSFYQPSLVIADTELLSTLPRRELNAGMAEVIKYAAIGCTELDAVLRDTFLGNRSGESVDARLQNRMERIVHLCCAAKAGYVERDERDTGDRMMLNFGHTFGHAIEKFYAFEQYIHGEAVAIGMVLAVRAGVLFGETSADAAGALTSLLDAAGIGYRLECPVNAILPLMAGDKKNSGDEITLILLRRFGEPYVCRVKPEVLSEAFKPEAEGAVKAAGAAELSEKEPRP